MTKYDNYEILEYIFIELTDKYGNICKYLLIFIHIEYILMKFQFICTSKPLDLL